ncbi:MAG: hypothetical protein PsegKO_30580 [Pseudohongiellaceae bacterium]|jgi:CRISPR/Cas system CSM-associated protein Csm3 (group 7 of RAMP superfamily)
MNFKIVGEIRDSETFASGRGIRELSRLRKIYGLGNRRKRKGVAEVQFENGATRTAEIHWYEATGIGQKEHKIKRFLD